MDKSSISRIVFGLRTRGLVEIGSAKDRRFALITLTREGMEAAQLVQEALHAALIERLQIPSRMRTLPV